MAAWADASERFVEIPGIVEIRWVSDDPDYYVAPIDLFDEQKNGLPDFYGKKDKTTTEQAWFTCNVCECDLKSVVTLRAHCKGTQHIRKALQKKKEYRKRLKQEAIEAAPKSENYRTLFEWLDQGTSEAVVGLEYVTEYLSGDSRDVPYYHCKLNNCNDEQGTAEDMKNHLLSLRHKQSWLESKTGSFLRHQTEISQRIAEFTKDFRRDFREMKVVKDFSLWRTAREGRIRERQSNSSRVKKEYEESNWKRKSRDDEGYNEREEKRRRVSNERDDFETERNIRDNDSMGSYRTDRSIKHETDRYYYNEERQFKYERERSPRERPMASDYPYVKHESSRDKGYHRDEHSYGCSNSDRRYGDEEYREQRSRVYSDDSGIEEVSRTGNFSNWKTATVKVDRDSNTATTSTQHEPQSKSQMLVEEEVDRLHRKVATKVMKTLNRYYPGSEDFNKDEYKIGSAEEYSKLAKEFSHRLRRQVKESYEAYHGTLEGIALTGDHEQFIRTEVESYFESVRRLR